jgi:hypothetical protein
VDLCHFGVPDWLGNFQNPDFATQFANYAGAFADRYPWIQVYTPVNEMFICAIFSGQIWLVERADEDRSGLRHRAQEHRQRQCPGDDGDFEAPAGRHLCPVRILGIFPRDSPAAIGPAEKMNSRRFLSLDLNYGAASTARCSNI